MELIIFVVFLVLSLILIALGLFIPEHSELSLIGFFFLFLLAMLILFGTITHKTGTQNNVTCEYADGNLTGSIEEVTDIYTPITMDGTLSHSFGYWLALISVVGFIGVIVALKRTW